MSPEQSRGEPLDSRSDLFSLGSVLFEMSTAHRPFKAETDYGIVRRIAEETPRPIREINAELPQWFEWIVQRLHEKSPDDRVQTAGELACLLEECLAHLQQPTKVPLPKTLLRQAESKSASQRRRLVRRAAWGLSIVCGLALIFWVMPHLVKTPDVTETGDEQKSRDEPSAGASAPDKDEKNAADAALVEDSAHAQIPSWEDDAFEQILRLQDESLRLEEEAGRLWGE
jgi:serine/threonine protein kinase